MLSKKEELLKDNYKVNKKEYFRLLREENEFAWDFEEWKIFYKWVGINKKLNNLFEKNPFIYKLLCGPAYPNLISDKNKYGYIGKLDQFSFDHTTSIQLRSDVSKISCPDTVTGIITFPYFNDWVKIKEWIDKVPEDNYSVYIINPILLYYGIGTVGLFLTPKCCNGYYIEACNRYIIGLTGYPLFLTFSSENNVDKIKHVDLELSKENFISELYEKSGRNKSLLKMLNFWKDNKDIKIPFVEDQYEFYRDVQPYHSFNDITFIKIISNKTFKLVHEDTNQVFGPFKEFSLDKAFNIIDTENGKFKLSDNELNDLLNGKYDFMID